MPFACKRIFIEFYIFTDFLIEVALDMQVKIIMWKEDILIYEKQNESVKKIPPTLMSLLDKYTSIFKFVEPYK